MYCPREYWSIKAALFALAFACFLPSFASAETPPSIIFERFNIRIDPVAIIPTPPPAKDGTPQPAPPQRTSTSYNIEMRGEEALRLEYIESLNTLSDSTGSMIVFNGPSLVSLPAWHVYTPVDALFISENGTIVQILPNVVLADMQDGIAAKQPIKAFLFLQAGQVNARHILPKDVIAGSMFTPAPPLMR